jgi:hypothetical protein
MLRIPVAMHSMPEEKVFHPKILDNFIKNVKVRVNLC